MINVLKLKTFPMFVRRIYFPTNEDKKFNIIFLSENDDFKSVYPRLNIKRQYAKQITGASLTFPRYRVTPKELIPYKELGLIPKLDPTDNAFIDAGPVFTLLNNYFGNSYIVPKLFSKSVEYLNSIKDIGDDRYNVLIYHVNSNKEISKTFKNRKSFLLAKIAKIGDGMFPFDCVILVIEKGGIIKFTALYNKKGKHLPTARIMTILKSVGTADSMEDEPADIEESKNNDNEKLSILKTINKFQRKKMIL